MSVEDRIAQMWEPDYGRGSSWVVVLPNNEGDAPRLDQTRHGNLRQVRTFASTLLHCWG